MPNFTPHLIAGTVSAGTMDIGAKLLKNEPVRAEEILYFTADLSIGALGGLLPDLLEPALSPRHRKFFHSMVFIALISGGLIYLWQQQQVSKWVKWPVTILGVAIAVHLLLDSTTPAGLPVA
jgi:inner membrane protein